MLLRLHAFCSHHCATFQNHHQVTVKSQQKLPVVLENSPSVVNVHLIYICRSGLLCICDKDKPVIITSRAQRQLGVFSILQRCLHAQPDLMFSFIFRQTVMELCILRWQCKFSQSALYKSAQCFISMLDKTFLLINNYGARKVKLIFLRFFPILFVAYT